MNYLLDTHTWIWSQESPEKLGAQATKALTDPAQRLYVSTISTLEIARLIAVGMIELSGRLETWISRSLGLLNGNTIELSHPIAVGAYGLPKGFHRDPADRILVATARIHRTTLLTADQRILKYRHVRSQDARR